MRLQTSCRKESHSTPGEFSRQSSRNLWRALKSGGTRATSPIRMAPGRHAFMAARSWGGVMRSRPGRKKLTTCPRACTPESVRPAACSRSSCGRWGRVFSKSKIGRSRQQAQTLQLPTLPRAAPAAGVQHCWCFRIRGPTSDCFPKLIASCRGAHAQSLTVRTQRRLPGDSCLPTRHKQ